MKYNKGKYTPPFRVGRKQGKAVLDSKGLEVIFMHDENQAQEYCEYLNTASKVRTYLEDDDWVITYPSGQEGKLFVGWENSLGECSAELLTLDELYDKYPWIQHEKMKRDLYRLGLNVKIKKLNETN